MGWTEEPNRSKPGCYYKQTNWRSDYNQATCDRYARYGYTWVGERAAEVEYPECNLQWTQCAGNCGKRGGLQTRSASNAPCMIDGRGPTSGNAQRVCDMPACATPDYPECRMGEWSACSGGQCGQRGSQHRRTINYPCLRNGRLSNSTVGRNCTMPACRRSSSSGGSSGSCQYKRCPSGNWSNFGATRAKCDEYMQGNYPTNCSRSYAVRWN